MSKEEPSQLPAEIKDSVTELAALIATNGQWLEAIQRADTAEQAYAALDHARGNQVSMSEAAQRLLVLVRVAQLPQIAVVALKKADPAPVARQQELSLPPRERWTQEEVVNARRCSGEKGDEE